VDTSILEILDVDCALILAFVDMGAVGADAPGPVWHGADARAINQWHHADETFGRLRAPDRRTVWHSSNTPELQHAATRGIHPGSNTGCTASKRDAR
jgi:hypothetical protein